MSQLHKKIAIFATVSGRNPRLKIGFYCKRNIMKQNQFLYYRRSVMKVLEEYYAVRKKNNVKDKGLSASMNVRQSLLSMAILLWQLSEK